MYFGWSDTALNPLMGVGYYERVLSTMGKETKDFYRLFMVPGMAHCRGGRGTDRFDALTPLVYWVEEGVAPESLVASHAERGTVTMTRPLCPYPMVARYHGSGDVNDAANFTCANPYVVGGGSRGSRKDAKGLRKNNFTFC